MLDTYRSQLEHRITGIKRRESRKHTQAKCVTQFYRKYKLAVDLVITRILFIRIECCLPRKYPRCLWTM